MSAATSMRYYVIQTNGTRVLYASLSKQHGADCTCAPIHSWTAHPELAETFTYSDAGIEAQVRRETGHLRTYRVELAPVFTEWRAVGAMPTPEETYAAIDRVNALSQAIRDAANATQEAK